MHVRAISPPGQCLLQPHPAAARVRRAGAQVSFLTAVLMGVARCLRPFPSHSMYGLVAVWMLLVDRLMSSLIRSPVLMTRASIIWSRLPVQAAVSGAASSACGLFLIQVADQGFGGFGGWDSQDTADGLGVFWILGQGVCKEDPDRAESSRALRVAAVLARSLVRWSRKAVIMAWSMSSSRIWSALVAVVMQTCLIRRRQVSR